MSDASSPTFAEIRAKSKIYNKFCRLISHNPLRCNGRTFSGSFVVPIAYLHYRNVCYFNLIWSPVKLKKAPAVAGPQAPPGDDDQGVIDGVLAQSVSHTHTTSLGPVLAGLHFWDKLGMPELLDRLGFTELHSAV